MSRAAAAHTKHFILTLRRLALIACMNLTHVQLEFVLRDGAIEGLAAAFYAVLRLSIPLGKLSNYIVWAGRGLPRGKALAEAHRVSGDEAMRKVHVIYSLRRFFLCRRNGCGKPLRTRFVVAFSLPLRARRIVSLFTRHVQKLIRTFTIGFNSETS